MGSECRSSTQGLIRRRRRTSAVGRRLVGSAGRSTKSPTSAWTSFGRNPPVSSNTCCSAAITVMTMMTTRLTDPGMTGLRPHETQCPHENRISARLAPQHAPVCAACTRSPRELTGRHLCPATPRASVHTIATPRRFLTTAANTACWTSSLRSILTKRASRLGSRKNARTATTSVRECLTSRRALPRRLRVWTGFACSQQNAYDA